MLKNILLALTLLLLTGFQSVAQDTPAAKYGFIISVDGLRPDAVNENVTPVLSGLIHNGSYTGRARTINLPLTLPAHTSLITGLTYESHAVNRDSYSENMGFVKQDTIFRIAKENGLNTAFITGKKKLKFLVHPDDIDFVYIRDFHKEDMYVKNTTTDVMNGALAYIDSARPGLALIHFPEPDFTGHQSGWMSAQYLDAVSGVDEAIGKIIMALKNRNIYDDSVIIITSDHGGSGKTHGAGIPHSYEIPWLAVGMNVKSGFIIQEPVRLEDTAPTILKALGIRNINHMDGRVVEEIFNQERPHPLGSVHSALPFQGTGTETVYALRTASTNRE